MATMNESIFNTPNARRALKLHEQRIVNASNARSERHLETGFERKLATAICLENTRRQIKVMESINGTATQPANVGQYKRFAMDMVAALIPNLVAPDLVSVQALDNRVGMINVLQQVYGSNKGSVKAGDVYSSPLAYQGMDKDYSSAQITSEVVDESANSYTLQWTPVKPTTVHVYRAGEEQRGFTFKEDGTHSAGTLQAGDVISYMYDNESVPVQSPVIGLDIKSLPVTTQSRKLTAIWSFDAQYELMKEYGQDMPKILAAQAVSEMQQEIDNEITSDLYRIANAGPELVWSRRQPTGVSQIDHRP